MRVMSWNLWWRFDCRHQVTVGTPGRGADHWQARERGIVSTLQAVQPDIAGFQEVWATAEATQADLLAEHLGLHAAFGAPSLPPPPESPESDHTGVEVGVAVLSRWPIVDVQHVLLPSAHRPNIVALAVAVDHPGGPLHVVASCIDWEAQFAEQRRAQTRALARLLTDLSRDGPAFLTVDLNAPPTAPEVQVLTDVMVDSWVAAGGTADAGQTLSSKNPLAPREAWQLDQRIDYVLARPGPSEHATVVERAFVIGEARDGVHASDHYAVVADVRL
jgi:endonuclease/exonuclease/phosphatase family metal-dependent hydrolase